MITTTFTEKLERRLQVIYPDEDHGPIIDRIMEICDRYVDEAGEVSICPVNDDGEPQTRWSEHDVILITYGNSVARQGEVPIRGLYQFLDRYARGFINSVHILPFFPYSSDDGFSVIDYRTVNPEWGDWDDVDHISRNFDLMADLVINHASRDSLWFLDFLNGQGKGKDFFIEVDPSEDVSEVVRPRNSPLLVPVHTPRGLKYVWGTFSDDQIDLNFANPDVLIEMIDVFFDYVRRGSRYIRLDAVAFLWKIIGTNCIHLPQTHEVVKLLRDLVDHIAPHAIIITETNVPVKENLSYFGYGDEAHMVYQFGLPPLVLHALIRGNGQYLTDWAINIPPLPKDCTYLNFTASHDGIGVRSVEGIVPDHEVADMIETMHEFGGLVTMRALPDGSDTPYEINISLFDALMGTRKGPDQYQIPRFLCSQSIMLVMQGIPAIYIHSLVASPNDTLQMERTGRTRSINRRLWDRDELDALLSNPGTTNAQVYEAYRHLLRIRREQSAFHPDSGQQVFNWGHGLFVLLRIPKDPEHSVLTVHNLTQHEQRLDREKIEAVLGSGLEDLLSIDIDWDSGLWKLKPYEFVWLKKLPN